MPQGLQVLQLAAAKFHTAAVCDDGKLYTWGFGRGGRLGAWWQGLGPGLPWAAAGCR
jgi:alpha-tubulin suppressor-like RCC1 family protein